jgi:hypothetical protein
MRRRAPSTAAGSPRYSASASRTWDSERRPVAVGSDPNVCKGIRPPRQHPYGAGDRIELSTPGLSPERTDVRRRPQRSAIVFAQAITTRLTSTIISFSGRGSEDTGFWVVLPLPALHEAPVQWPRRVVVLVGAQRARRALRSSSSAPSCRPAPAPP